MSGLKPHVALEVGGTRVPVGALRALRARRELSGGVDVLRVVLDARVAVDAAEGDAVTLELGWDGEGTSVFTGEVVELGTTVRERIIEAHGPQLGLARLRPDESFEQMSAGDVFSALADSAGISAGEVSAGASLGHYHADGRATAFDHAKRLAQLSGVEIYTRGDDKLHFAPTAAGAGGAGALAGAAAALAGGGGGFQYGVNVVEARLAVGSVTHGAVEVVPASPASQQGTEAATWIVKDSRAIAASAGDGDSRRFSSGVCDTVEAAQMAADALAADLARQRAHGHLVTPGSPDTQPGDSVDLSGFPHGDGSYEVWAVTHRLEPGRGFRSRIDLRGTP